MTDDVGPRPIGTLRPHHLEKSAAMKKSDILIEKCVKATEKWGAVLVYPHNNRPEPPSLWSALHPKIEMRWTWDEGADNRVGELWHLREKLSRSRKVVYSKWYQGRATFFSRELFVALYRYAHSGNDERWQHHSRESHLILEALKADSPQSTKQIKEACGLQGKFLESQFHRAIKPLWQSFDIVGFGEIEDSSFPSLAHAATELIFEDLVEESRSLSRKSSLQKIEQALTRNPKMLAAWQKQNPPKKLQNSERS